MKKLLILIKILLIFLILISFMFSIACNPNQVQADDIGSFKIKGHYNTSEEKIFLSLIYDNSTYTDSTTWPLHLPAFDWTIKEGRRMNNTPNEIRYDTHPFLANTNKWSKTLPDSLKTGTYYYYFSGTCNDNDNKNFVGYADEGKNYFRTSLPDETFENNSFDTYLDTASSYLNVPYIWGDATFETTIGEIQTINKTMRQGYYGIDCSGLVNWTLLKNGNPLQFTGEDSVIVGNTNAHAIWQQKVNQGLVSCGWGAWCDGVVYFLDTNNPPDNTVDHVGFWYDDGFPDGKTIHAVGGDISRVVLSDLDPRYHDSWLFDAADIQNQTERRIENEFVKK